MAKETPTNQAALYELDVFFVSESTFDVAEKYLLLSSEMWSFYSLEPVLVWKGRY